MSPSLLERMRKIQHHQHGRRASQSHSRSDAANSFCYQPPFSVVTLPQHVSVLRSQMPDLSHATSIFRSSTCKDLSPGSDTGDQEVKNGEPDFTQCCAQHVKCSHMHA